MAQDLRFTNTVLNIKYGFANKLYAEATMAYMGSDKLSSSNRYQLFPAVGLGWVLSEENFMKDIEAIDFLKLKGSFGIMGYDNSMPYYLYVNRWNTNGNVQFNERNNTTISRTILEQTGNPDIGWEKSREYNIGLEGLMFDLTGDFLWLFLILGAMALVATTAAFRLPSGGSGAIPQPAE